MSTNIKTPGVYVKEVSLFPPSVAQVATAVPAFLGYTEKATTDEGTAIAGAFKIKSLAEYHHYFGAAYLPQRYTVSVDTANGAALLGVAADKRFYLYDAVRHYFDNGGGPCYILSLGDYATAPADSHFTDGITAVEKLDEPTLLVLPDAVLLDDATALGGVQQRALASCAKLQDRFAILDVFDGFREETPAAHPIQDFRDTIGINNLTYGAAYYPWLVASYPVAIDYRQLQFVDETDAPITDLSLLSASAAEAAWVTAMQEALADTDRVLDIHDTLPLAIIRQRSPIIVHNLGVLESELRTPDIAYKMRFTNYLSTVVDMVAGLLNAESDISNASVVFEVGRLKADADVQAALTALVAIGKNTGTVANATAGYTLFTDAMETALGTGWLGEGVAYDDITPEAAYDSDIEGVLAAIDRMKADVLPLLLETYDSLLGNILFFEQQASTALFGGHRLFMAAAARITVSMRTLPPSGAVAGVYAAVDGARGVWKAPANVSLNNVIGPAVKIDAKDQESLNVHETGKSVNALRAFTGKGTLVWGARTLAGNDNEWRYVSVRRFFIMVEESVKKATEPFVFENNDANTWVKIQVMIENFLTLQWRAGALQGAKTTDAFYVAVGLHKTMTAQDILEGRLIVEIGMAVVRPAEFIILRFSHKMVE